VRRLITQAHDEAREILVAHRDALDGIAKALLENETLDAAEVAEVFGDIPKWEHVGNGSLRIQAPSQPVGAGIEAISVEPADAMVIPHDSSRQQL
ncbi:MAG: cell division protein FtsH, partial [Actinomycetota bacterium]|nr:cell division protein FtsH [Actinomycetota bacterium]